MRRLLFYTKPYTAFFVVAVFVVLVSSIVDLTPPLLVRNAIDKYMNDQQLGAQERFSGLSQTSLLLLVVFAGQFLLNYGSVYLTAYLGNKIVYDIRSDLFGKILNLPMSFFDKTPSGRITTRVVNDTENLQQFFTTAVTSIIKDFFLMAGVIFFMIRLNLALFFRITYVFPLVLAGVLLFRYFDKRVYREVRTNLARVNAYLAEHISGINVIKLFNAEQFKNKEFDGVNRNLYRALKKQLYVFGVFRPFIDLSYFLALSGIIWFGSRYIAGGTIQFGELYAFVAYIDIFMRPLQDIAEKYDIVQNSFASSEKIFSLMDEKPENLGNPRNTLVIKRGNLEFRNVWFSYDSEKWVLKDVNLKFTPGELTAIVGETGAGKTSLMNLINGMYVPQKGEIIADGKNIFDCDLRAIRKQISAVPQDVILFSGTILDNIRLFNNNYTENEVENALKSVHALEVINRLPEGVHTRIIERGSTLSAGERQLIALARAVLFDAQILILDEATSNVDVETESRIELAVREFSTSKTVIMIAHRLSTVRNADRIIVIHNGHVVEEGKHSELMQKRGVYYKLYQIQFAI